MCTQCLELYICEDSVLVPWVRMPQEMAARGMTLCALANCRTCHKQAARSKPRIASHCPHVDRHDQSRAHTHFPIGRFLLCLQRLLQCGWTLQVRFRPRHTKDMVTTQKARLLIFDSS